MFQSRGKRVVSDSLPIANSTHTLEDTLKLRPDWTIALSQHETETRSTRTSCSTTTESTIAMRSKQKAIISVLEEFRDSEAAYVHDLHVAQRYYADRLSDRVKKSEWKDVFEIFLVLCKQASLFEIEMHKSLNDEINYILDDQDACLKPKPSVAQLFLSWLPKLSAVYGRYCVIQENIGKKVEKWMKNSSISEYLQECDSMAKIESNSWNLDSFLVKPVQRFLKYPLLLNQLYRSASLGIISDYVLLGEACHKSEIASQRMNELKRRRDIIITALDSVSNSQEVLLLSTDSIDKKIAKLQNSTNIFYVPEHEPILAFVHQLSSSYTNLLNLRSAICDWLKFSRYHYLKFFTFVEAYSVFCKDTKSADKWALISVALDNIAKGAVLRLTEQCQTSVLRPISNGILFFRNPLCVTDVWIKKATAFSKRRQSQVFEEDLESFPLLSNCLLEELPLFLEMARNVTDECILAFAQIQATFYDTIQKVLEPVVAKFNLTDHQDIPSIESIMDFTSLRSSMESSPKSK